MRKSTTYMILIFVCFVLTTQAQKDSSCQIRAGIFVNKMLGFYWLNGISVEMNSKKLYHGKIDLGINLYSSSLGSAFLSNAIPVHAIEVYGQKRFRVDKKLNPLVGLDLGFAKAFYGDKSFDLLPQSSLLVAPEFGVGYKFIQRACARFTLGYNVLSGSGVKGGGFIYPVCLRLKVLYTL